MHSSKFLGNRIKTDIGLSELNFKKISQMKNKQTNKLAQSPIKVLHLYLAFYIVYLN
jgi:hypothetical protein